MALEAFDEKLNTALKAKDCEIENLAPLWPREIVETKRDANGSRSKKPTNESAPGRATATR